MYEIPTFYKYTGLSALNKIYAWPIWWDFYIKIEERKSLAKKLAYAKCHYGKESNKNHDDINTEIPDNKIEFSDHQQCVVLQNNDDKAGIGNRGSNTKSKKDTRDDKENTQNVIKALDSTIIPLRWFVISSNSSIISKITI